MHIKLGTESRGRVRWSAIVAGLVVAVGVITFTLASSCAVGLTALDPTPAHLRLMAYGILAAGAFALWLGGFTGSFIAAGAADSQERRDGIVHGFVLWAALATLLLAPCLALFAGVLNSIFVTGGTVTADDATMMDEMAGSAREQMVATAHEAAKIFWICWAALGGSLTTSIAGGWLGGRSHAPGAARGEHGRR